MQDVRVISVKPCTVVYRGPNLYFTYPKPECLCTRISL